MEEGRMGPCRQLGDPTLQVCACQSVDGFKLFPYNQNGCSIHREPGILNLLLFSKHLHNIIKSAEVSFAF